ncbi:MAG: hypothetical protein KGN84_19015 [Acidobacteriota bacterium]|nr:hypothetical protein [Acidobacteriota bacterium]
MSFPVPAGESTRSRLARLVWRIAPLFFLIPLGAFAQQPACVYTTIGANVHQEGLAERIGDLTITCSGGTVGAAVSLQMFVTTNAVITNRLDSAGDLTGITLTGATFASLSQTSASTLSFTAVSYVAAPGPTVITIGGIRVAVAPLQAGAPITASILGVGAQFSPSAPLVVATPQATLLASLLNNGVPCGGSSLPSTLDFLSFSASSLVSTIRLTEAAVSSFSAKEPGADSGVRIMVNITGYGPNARVFVPDAIVGNSGTQPTSAGAFASALAPGTYTPGGSGGLLLIRVAGADASGAGGSLAFNLPNATTTFGTMSEVALTGGSGSVVYEVVDASSFLQETAQIPVFVVVPTTTCPSTLTPSIDVKLAPLSTVAIPTQKDPIPRFVSIAPPLDCTAKGDCSAFYFPQFTVDTTPIKLSAPSLGGAQTANIKVGNIGQGLLNFTTSITYGPGATGWLSVTPSSGTNNVTLQAIANPASLNPGTYTANLTVSAAPYGMGTVPVTFTVGPVGVTIQNVGNAASYTYGTVAPGSYAVLFGLNLQGASVTFNGLPATVVFSNASQINLIVPSALAGQQNASVIATVNGMMSNSFIVALALNSPGVFNPGIVNSDGSINSSAHPAKRGDYVSVYLTGLAIIGGNTTGTVTMNFGTLMNQPVLYAGSQPTYPALDQVNVTVPSSLPATPNPVQIEVCIPGPAGQPVCSNQTPLYIQ